MEAKSEVTQEKAKNALLFGFPNYNAVADAWIEEPIDAIDTEEERDTIRRNLLALGTMRNFNQTINAKNLAQFFLVWTRRQCLEDYLKNTFLILKRLKKINI